MLNTNNISSAQDLLEPGITISSSKEYTGNDIIIINGVYKVPFTEDSIPKQGILIPKQIVLVATRNANYKALKPFSDVVVFKDDVHDDGKYSLGKFTINVLDYIEFNGAGDYYMLCSLGKYLSNIISVTIE